MTSEGPEDPYSRLISRVITQMGFPVNMRDEAFSEGLVAVAKGLRSFDTKRQVPLANWLAKNIRWQLNNWRIHQPYHTGVPIPETHESPKNEFSSSDLKEVLTYMDNYLTYDERTVLWASALGYTGVHIARTLGTTSVNVTRIKQRAQEKLREAYRMKRMES